MSLAIENIVKRILVFSECLKPFDDCAKRHEVPYDVVCSNCGEICKKISFAGKTVTSSERRDPFAYLCFGCARAYQHCLRHRNIGAHLKSFRDCFQGGYVYKATTGIHADYKNISPPPKITCFNCGCRCKEEYFHAVKQEPLMRLYNTSIGNVFEFRSMLHPLEDCADICFNCCRAFFVGQAIPFSSDSVANEFNQLNMKPRLCLTKEDFAKHYTEQHWLMMQYREWRFELAMAKAVKKPPATKKQHLKTKSC